MDAQDSVQVSFPMLNLSIFIQTELLGRPTQKQLAVNFMLHFVIIVESSILSFMWSECFGLICPNG